MNKVYFITDSSTCSEEEFYSRIDSALKVGVDLLQLREKELSTRAFYERALRVKELCDLYSTPLIINDRMDIALAVGAGLHVGDSDLPVSVARGIMGEDAIIGASAKSVEKAVQAMKEGANYLGVGAIFDTTTKVITKRTSLDTLQAIIQEVNIPVYAIGGIFPENVEVLDDVDIEGVAVVSAIMKAKDIFVNINALRRGNN